MTNAQLRSRGFVPGLGAANVATFTCEMDVVTFCMAGNPLDFAETTSTDSAFSPGDIFTRSPNVV